MMMRKLMCRWIKGGFLFYLLCCFHLQLSAQEVNNQVLRGKILDNSTQNPIEGALVEMFNVSPRKADYSKNDGNFRLEDIPIGRQRILIKAQGYQEIVLSEINITAGKEAVIFIRLDEEIEEDVTSSNSSDRKPKVLLRNSKMRPTNPMALVSTRSFTIDEVKRYAGGLNDPARLVASFASTFNTDDSQNYIVSRGNAPFGIRYFIEGVPIDNPNHFHTLGNTGSALAMLNPYVLDNSDFLTSAFPAEYGTAFSGIFDIHLREGNNQKHEFSAQVGLLGLEAAAEGPIQKNKSSYLLNYRYSLFSFVQLLQIDVGTSALPQYQDGTFKLSFPSSKIGDISIFGMGGYSTVAFFNDEIDENDIFAEKNRDLYLYAGSAITGLNHRKNLSKRTYLNTSLSNVYLHYRSYRDSIAPDNSKHPYYEVNEDQIIPGISTYINSKINRRVLIKTGLRAYLYLLDIDDGFLDRDQKEYIFDGNIWDGQAFFEAMIKFNRFWTMNAGVFGQYMNLNANSYTVEPRFSLAFQPSIPHRFTLGYGWHSKHIPFITSFLVQQQPDGSYNMGNRELGFIRSHQTELAYHWQIGREWRLKAELFGQYLTDIPIESTPSSYSLINYGVFALYPKIINLVSEGEAYNYGLDLTLEKFFSKGYYGHVAATYFHSRYLASDGIWRSTGNDVRYIVQFLGGKEFKIGKRKLNTINIDFRLHHRGGRPYTPINLTASQAAGQEIRDESNAYSVRTRTYTRLDLKVGGRFNGRRNRISHYFYIDMINFSDLVAGLANSDYFQNDLLFTFDPINERIAKSTQFGLFPTFAYQIQF